MSFPVLFLIIYLSVTLIIAITCFIEIGIFGNQTIVQASWLIIFLGFCTVFSESRPYKLHELKYWKNRIIQIEQKIEFADNDIDKWYFEEVSLKNAHIKYDKYYYDLFNEDPYSTIIRAKNKGE